MKKMLGDIFKDIISGCNRLISSTISRSENPKDSACNRLRLVLMHDRTKLDPATLEKMRDELVEVISKYVEIDKELLNIDLASEGNEIALVASIPVIRAKQLKEDAPETTSSDENHPNLYDHEDDFDEEHIEHVIVEDSEETFELEDDDWDDFFNDAVEITVESVQEESDSQESEESKEEHSDNSEEKESSDESFSKKKQKSSKEN